jgi:hypothetical protein
MENIQYGVVLEEAASSLTQGWNGLSMTEQANAHYYPR